ncbi:MAG: formylmethanofuran dehydrogenase subunit E family protein [Thermoplasmata archaeon]|nr:formylmethanofuran dehydrogenase subunit E family protein [Thermoplasmata archaeon]
MNETLEMIKRFHGHLGPYVVLGYRMGKIANRFLGEDPFKKNVTLLTGTKPPVSCIIDGVQLSSGCTLGKGNVNVIDEHQPAARFTDKNGKTLHISIKEDVIKEIEKAFKDQKDVTENLFNRSDEELFEMRFNGSGNRT